MSDSSDDCMIIEEIKTESRKRKKHESRTVTTKLEGKNEANSKIDETNRADLLKKLDEKINLLNIELTQANSEDKNPMSKHNKLKSEHQKMKDEYGELFTQMDTTAYNLSPEEQPGKNPK